MADPANPANPANPDDDAIRFLDILTVASSVARVHGDTSVLASHLLEAIAVLTGELDAGELGEAVSPLAQPRGELAVDAAIRDLTKRWFTRLGETPDAALDADALAALEAELKGLVDAD